MSIAKVRQAVLRLVNTNPELYEECDLDILRRDDDYVGKYFQLVDNKFLNNNEANEDTIKEVVKQIDGGLKQRKSSGVCHLNQRDFPSEFYQHKGFATSRDAHGDRILYILGHLHCPNDDFRRAIVDWFAFEIKKFEETNRGSLVFDCRKMGLSNCDVRFVTEIVNFYNIFPTLDWTFYAVDIPFLLNPVFKVVLKLLPARFSHKLKIVSRSEFRQLIGKDVLWTKLGGNMDIVNEIPEECCTMDEFAEKRQLSNESVQKMLNAYKAIGAL